MERRGKIMKAKFWLLLVVGLLSLAVEAWAESPATDNNNDEGEIPVVTVRKRYFLKTHRSEIGLNAGIIPNDTFVKSYMIGASYGYHFSESVFLEIPGGIITNSDSDASTYLQKTFGVHPDTDDMNYYVSAQLGWSP